MRLVIPPEDPDLDGVASSYAYAEYLKNKDIKGVGAVFGDPDDETEEVLERIDEEVSDASYYMYSADEFTLVSASTMDNVTSRVSEDKVTEVIDHEDVNLGDFSNAETEINEDAGSASTIIAEKFRDGEVEPSQESAELLLAAIKSGEMTDLDREMVEWLEEQL